MLETIARTCYRRRRWVAGLWLLLVAVLLWLAGSAGGTFTSEFDELPGAGSQQAYTTLADHFPDQAGGSATMVFAADAGLDAAPVRDRLQDLFASVEAQVPGATVVGPYEPGGEHAVADGGTIGYAELALPDTDEQAEQRAVTTIRDLAAHASTTDVQVELAGDQFVEESEFSTEGVGMLAAVVILLIAFGSVVAMGLPIVTALVGVGSGVALVQLLANVITMPDFTTQVAIMIGVGVGIDYALFIVTRYREALAAGRVPEAAVIEAMTTAGRAVVFAGLTVVVSLVGLAVIQLSLIQALAIAAGTAVLLVMAAAVTLVPALLGMAGRGIDRFGLPHRRRAGTRGRASVWHRWSTVIQRRPVVAALPCLALVIALGAPVVSMRLGFADAGSRPTTDTTRRAYDLIAEGFGPGFNGPLLLAAELPAGEDDLGTLEALRQEVDATAGVALATPPQPSADGGAAVMQVFPDTAPQSAATADLVHRLRDDVIPAAVAGTDVAVHVGGVTASAIDFADYLGDRLPLFIGLVLTLSFVLLLVVFRSLLVPLKAVVMNLLSIGAGYGLIVAVFQWGWASDLTGVTPGPIEAWVPMMLFAIVFGLSMDYEVFLLSRVREHYGHTGDNARAVADGLAGTARIITAAAAIMVAVFGGFALSSERGLQLLGLGLAAPILVDATLIRLVLVPATMELLGDANWWLPRPLRRWLPDIHVEGPAPAPPAAEPAASVGRGRR